MLVPNLEKNSNIVEDKGRPPFIKRSIFIYLIIVLLIGSFGLGVIIGQKKSVVKIISTAGVTEEFGELTGKDGEIPEYLGKDVQFRIFWDAWNIIQEKYIERPVGETQLFYGALGGMVASLDDPYTRFMIPQKATDFHEEIKGRFEGTGMEIGIRNDVLTVVSPLPESPAEKAGIRAADVITKIDDYSTENIDLSEAVTRIRGDKGTVVNLEIYRPKTAKFLEIPVTRDVIRIVSVSLKEYSSDDFEILTDKKVSYIRVTNFNSDTEGRFSQAVQDILLYNPDGLILDLRSNPGGLLDAAVNMTDWWLEQGQSVVKEEFSGGEEEIHLASTEATLDKFKTVVLINGGSASGSEIVAGALQDHGVAVLIGEQTFGKGSVQELVDLDDGSAVKITIARWLTPNGRTIDKEGIAPDIEVERTEEDYNLDNDPQLERAIEYFVE